MTLEKGFPRQLLDSSRDERYEYFKDKTIRHDKLTRVHEQVKKAVHYAPRGSLIFVIGTTGVGKTTLQHGLMREITEEMRPRLEKEKGIIPVAAIEADAPTHGGYDFKGHFKQTLRSVLEPLIDYKIDTGLREITTDENGRPVAKARASVLALREATEEAFRQRQLKAFFIDEAQHIAKTSSGVTLKDNLDVLKTIANKTKTTHILLGSYELLILLELSAQLTRRSKVIHFGRYEPDVELDVKSYRSVIGNFQLHSPFPQLPNLLPHIDFLIQHSLGCVGVLKEWLLRGVALALETDAESITREHLEATRLTDGEWLSLAAEIREAEARMEINQDQIVSLQEKLGFHGKARKNSVRDDSENKQTRKKGNQFPGRRNPKRDKVGK